MNLREQVRRALAALADPPPPAKPSEANPDGTRRFPHVPCDTDGCAGDLGHDEACGSAGGVS